MAARIDALAMSLSRAVLDVQETQAAAMRAVQLVDLQARETVRIDAERRLEQTRAMENSAASRRTGVGVPVNAVDGEGGAGDQPGRRRGRRPAEGAAVAGAMPVARTVVDDGASGRRVDIRL